ncbi:hypothetical protein JNUCC1_02333 [Lentibacillus sp. JNUCC-1]|uniref:hypothetical protein n=1 Tax=Lentibacillus sp. JNUCC-1 TaxID=2654513 RepID=UPI0013210835|nr:hypothetical protein [Lentibacillus sp. JNUCC-1]MUV38495.1 hypothetical protein [Lentibacillus sp. JNUCC-1]
MRKGEVNGFLETLLPETVVPSEHLNPAPARARKFYMLTALWPFFITLILTLIFAPSFVWLPGLLAVAAATLGWMQHRDAGVLAGEEWIHLRWRRFGLTQVVIHHRRLQAFEKKQDFIQKFQKLSTMEVSIIGMAGTGTHYTIRSLDTNSVDHLAEWFSYRRGINKTTEKA